MLGYIRGTTTTTGLKVEAYLDENVYSCTFRENDHTFYPPGRSPKMPLRIEVSA
jgi:hypothetical protein